MEYIKTSAGLPNTCSIGGEAITGEWFALNEDAAIAGQGVCEKHLKQLTAPKTPASPRGSKTVAPAEPVKTPPEVTES